MAFILLYYIVLTVNAVLRAGYFGARNGAEFIGNKYTRQLPLLVQIPKSVLVLTNSATYFQSVSCLFHSVVEVK